MKTVPLAEANYTLEALMVSYQNPTHMAVSLQAFRQGCCEASDTTLPCSPCDNAFRVCARESVTGVVWGPCDLAEMESELIEENNDDLVFNWGNVSGISNPIIVSGDMWPVLYINIKIFINFFFIGNCGNCFHCL